jgi:hypothetical protein
MWSRVLGVLFVVVGAVWFLQGIDVLGGSFMSGEIFWAVIGLPMVVIGLAILFPKRRSGPDAAG